MPSLFVHASISLIFHLLLIFAGDFYDQEITTEGPFYTDIDYHVVTDAAEHVLKNTSPYRRTTYRYTPLLAYLLTPNLWLDPRWGKFLFSIANVLVGLLIGLIVRKEDRTYALLWLYNPMSAVIATRGSYESIVAMLVLALVYQVKQENRRTWVTGILLALAVHFKIYPIIYSLALFFYIDESFSLRLTWNRIQFVLSFLMVTLILNGYFYFRYGYEYLYETYIYHVVRRDSRHNFSPYFYLTYLSPEHSLLSLITFLPQVINTFVCSIRLYDRLELCLFALTFAFVTFNKVVTSQYFLWYLIFLPILLPKVELKRKTLFLSLICWITAQVWWLYEAYRLEFQGENTFVEIWMASIVFGCVNVGILCLIMSNYSSKTLVKVSTEKKND